MPPEPARPVLSRRGLRITGIVLVVVAAVVVVSGVMTRRMADARLSEWAETQAIPTVAVATPDPRGKRTTIDLPGRLEAYSQAQLYARVSGYLKEWKADIGTPVKAGQLLAEIEAPDLDQQIMQAEAGVSSAQANAELASQTLQRGQSLVTSGAVSKQDLDRRSADSANQQGLVKSAQANLDRLRVLEKYKRITAPFDGVVTTRSTDIGDLISAGGTTATPLFTVADETKLRIYVRTPQNYSAGVQPGMTATFTVPEYPGRSFTAKLAASADAIAPQSGTLLVQLQIDNADKALKPGAYAQVRFSLPANGAIQVPATALMFRDSGMSVALVGAGGRV
ncbi:MAG: rane fusion protein multidrug efflux system, partial [Hyphomicrobiales bacterium]|nr:rane fusion protein multidrug efflux system [Hyphomicrobiales bacterium]